MSSANKVYFLSEAIPADIQLGGKAANLAQLSQAGFRVPAGFVLSTSFLTQALIGDSLRAEMLSAIEDSLLKIGGYPVAVRSSSLSEDLQGASFAGLYVSVLDVTNREELVAAIFKCWESAQAERVKVYQKQKNTGASSVPQMNVLIQKMVDAKHAGVTFTLNPMTGIENQMLVESCRGTGEKLVSGHVNPSRWVLKLFPFAIESHDAGDERAELTTDFLRELTLTALRVQAHFNHPQDIEWAQDQSGNLELLQSRPITHISWRKDVEEYTNADFKDGGVSARVCTPLMFSLYRNAMQGSMQSYFEALKLVDKKETWIDFFYGRPYWNASAVKRGLRKVPGFNEKNFDNDLGVQKNYGTKGPIITGNDVNTVLKVLPTAIALPKEYARQLELTQNYGSTYLKKERSYRARIQEFSKANDETFFALLRELFAFHRQTESDYFRTIYNNSTLQTDFKTLLQKSARPEDHISLLGLMGGLQNIGHLDIQRGLLKLYRSVTQDGVVIGDERWKILVEEFLSHHYFHADAELDLTCPRWDEVPERMSEIIKDFIRSNAKPQDPDQTSIKQHALFEAERDKALASIEKRLADAWWAGLVRESRKKKFLAELDKSRLYMSRREEMREYSTRTYALIRAVVLEAGRRLYRLGLLKAESDIFFLLSEEIESLCDTNTPPPDHFEKVEVRRLQFEGLRDLVPPNELGQGVTQRESHFARDANALSLIGSGCSPGIIEGPVRVIKTLDEAGTLVRGEILVTRFTDPGWTPVLGIAAGVITEVGGVLSHAAVIGREYGIPAILNLPGATQLLSTGQRIRMNGESGVIDIL